MSGSLRIARARVRYVPAILGGIGWTWALTLLVLRHHLVLVYEVFCPVPPAWGCLAVSGGGLLLASCVGAALAIGGGYVGSTRRQAFPQPTRWLLGAYAIPALDLLRLFGWAIPATFLEPLWLALVTGAAAGATAGDLGIRPGIRQRLDRVPWFAVVLAVAVAAGGWWYHQGQQAYRDYLLGFNDFARCGWRVANTWEGRGFLMDTPSLPAFWDHFNPGLALLAPLWGLWPDPRLFILIQAICLALPALFVYGMARRWGATPSAASVWAAAYLVFPAVGQFNLNYSYGWHPVSVSMVLIFAALWALLCGRRILSGGLALVACSFQEDVLVTLACLALAMALQARLVGRRRDNTASPEPSTGLLANQLPIWAWLCVGAVLIIGFVAIARLAAFAEFQIGRFAALGDSVWEIILSPLIRPRVFWGNVLRPRSAYFLLALLVPLGLRSVLRGWQILLAVALPVGVLLAWDFDAATSIAFQYSATLVPVLFLAALAGAAAAAGKPDCCDTTTLSSRRPGLWVGGISALAAGATASAAIGALPWSGPTLTAMVLQTYSVSENENVAGDRAVGSAGNAVLNEIVARVGGEEASVLASGRIASHLLGVRRLEAAGQAKGRWTAFQAEIGSGRSPIELFDWIVLDTKERFQQSEEDMWFLVDEARRAGYRLVQSSHGILVIARPPGTL